MKWLYILLVSLMFPTIISSGISTYESVSVENSHLTAYEEIQIKISDYEQELQRQLWIQEIKRFLDDIAFQESGNDWKNYFYNDSTKRAYIGKYQFGYAARKATGYGHINYWKWLDNPHIWSESEQDTAMIRYMKLNQKELQAHIMDIDSIPLWVDKIKITESGVLAAAHLAGSANVKKFFRRKGKYNPKDFFGTRLSDYLIEYSGYDFNLEIL